MTSRIVEVHCPSGLRVKLRSIKGKDIEGLRDQRRLQTGEAITELLDSCTVEILERGIYSAAPQFTWADALVGDRMSATVGLRKATSGPKFDFRMRCSDANCRQMINWELELDDLEQKPLSEEARATFLAGNEFRTTVDGREIVYTLTTGRGQARLAKLMQQIRRQNQSQREPRGGDKTHEQTMLGLASRIKSIEGVDNITAWLQDQDLLTLRDLIKTMDASDCGVETSIEIVCAGPNGCGLVQEVNLPLDQTFIPTPS